MSPPPCCRACRHSRAGGNPISRCPGPRLQLSSHRTLAEIPRAAPGHSRLVALEKEIPRCDRNDNLFMPWPASRSATAKLPPATRPGTAPGHPEGPDVRLPRSPVCGRVAECGGPGFGCTEA